MQVGSLVQCIRRCNGYVKGVRIVPDVTEGEILVVSGFIDFVIFKNGVEVERIKDNLLMFEEIGNCPHPLKPDLLCGYDKEHFREIQPPVDLQKVFIDEEIYELVKR